MYDDGYTTPVVRGDAQSVNPSEHGIDALRYGTAEDQVRRFGYFETNSAFETEEERVDYTRLVPPDDARRRQILTQVYDRQLIRPNHNRIRNRRMDDDEEEE